MRQTQRKKRRKMPPPLPPDLLRVFLRAVLREVVLRAVAFLPAGRLDADGLRPFDGYLLSATNFGLRRLDSVMLKLCPGFLLRHHTSLI
jgi:hypothetical protein